jgi:hypothetical protein
MARKVDLPEPPNFYSRDYMLRLMAALQRYLSASLDTQQSVAEFYLRSSGGKVYKVTVNDAGTLTTTLVQG